MFLFPVYALKTKSKLMGYLGLDVMRIEELPVEIIRDS